MRDHDERNPQLLGMSDATVKRWADAGVLPSRRTTPRSHRRFELRDVQTFLSGQRALLREARAQDAKSADQTKIDESLARVRAMGWTAP